MNEKLPKSKGQILITGEEQEQNEDSELIMFNPVAQNLNSSGLNFFIIYKWMGPNHYIPVYKSEIRKADG